MMNGMRRLIALPAVVALALLATTGHSAAAPTFALVDADISVDSSTGDGSSSLLLKADGLSTAELTQPLGEIRDLLSPLPPPLEITFTPNELPQADGSRRWVLVVAFKGVPRGAIQKRYLSFGFAGQKITLPYTMTNKSTATFSWSIQNPPAEVSLKAGGAIGIGIGVGVQSIPATHVHIKNVTLIEQSRKNPIDPGMFLCDKLTGTCETAGITLTATSQKQLWLRTSGSNPIIGKYVGAVTIVADQKPEGETINLTVYGTTLCRQLIGVFVIMLGVAGAWYASTYVQGRLSRAQALLPAKLLTERIDGLLKTLANPPETATYPLALYADSRGLLETWRTHLSEKELDANNLLPPSLPLPYKGMDANAVAYKKLITDCDTRIAHLDMVINQGFAAVWKRFPRAKTAADQTAMTNALDKLDDRGAAPAVPDRTETGKFIEQTLTDLDGKVPPPAALGGAPLAPDDVQPKSFDQIELDIRRLSGIVWIMFGGLATAVGSYILVFSNLGFGVSTDYLLCLFWGFGLPAGSQLMQSTVGTLGTALNINLPKAG